MSYQKRSSDKDPRSSSRYGKEPARERHCTKKRKQEDHKGIVISYIHLYHFVTIDRGQRSEHNDFDPHSIGIPICCESNIIC